MMPLMFDILGRMTGGLSPAIEGFTKVELAKALDYIGNAVGAGPYMMGANLTLADIQMSYCMAVLESAGFLAGRPALSTYWERLQAEPGFKRCVEIGGPLVLSRG
jgi:glutathione S-transferase